MPSLVSCLDGPPSLQDTLVQEGVERLGVLGVLTVGTVVVDVEVGEEGLVEQAAHLRVSRQVRSVAVAGQVQGGGEVGFDLVELGRGGAEPFLDGGKLAGDALLLARDEVQWHGVAVDGLDQLLPLGGELSFLGSQVLVFALGVLAAGGQLGAQALFDGVA